MKFILVDERETEIFTKEFATLEQAIEQGERDFQALTKIDRWKIKDMYILESVNPDEDAIDHMDGNPVYTWIENGEAELYYLLEKSPQGGNDSIKPHTLKEIKDYFKPCEDADENEIEAWQDIKSKESLQEFIENFINNCDGDWVHDYYLEKF